MTPTIESILHHLENHTSIIVTFLLVMCNHVEQNAAKRTLCIILEGIYESLRQMKKGDPSLILYNSIRHL